MVEYSEGKRDRQEKGISNADIKFDLEKESLLEVQKLLSVYRKIYEGHFIQDHLAML